MDRTGDEVCEDAAQEINDEPWRLHSVVSLPGPRCCFSARPRMDLERNRSSTAMPANLKHSIKAKTPVVMLLVLLK